MNRGLGKHDNRLREIREQKPEAPQEPAELGKAAEDYEACAAPEARQMAELKEAEQTYEDCAAEEQLRADEAGIPAEGGENDAFEDCGKEDEGRYVAEVTYRYDSEKTSDIQAEETIQEAYNASENPADMEALKARANENEHIQVVKAELVEAPTENRPEGEAAQALEHSRQQADAAREALVEKERQVEQAGQSQEAVASQGDGFEQWLDPQSYDEEGAYTGDYRPDGVPPDAYREGVEAQAREAYGEHLKGQPIPQEARGEAYAEYVDKLESREPEDTGGREQALEDRPKVLRRDPDALRAAGYSAIESRLDVERDEMLAKGMAEGPDMEAALGQRREQLRQEFERDAFGEDGHPGSEATEPHGGEARGVNREKTLVQASVEQAEAAEDGQNRGTDAEVSDARGVAEAFEEAEAEQTEVVEQATQAAIDMQADSDEPPLEREELARSMEQEAEARLTHELEHGGPGREAEGVVEDHRESIEAAAEAATEARHQEARQQAEVGAEQAARHQAELEEDAEAATENVQEAIELERLGAPELEQLSEEAAQAMGSLEREADLLEEQGRAQFEQLQAMPYKSEAYNQALKAYNETREQREAVARSADLLREKQETLDRLRLKEANRKLSIRDSLASLFAGHLAETARPAEAAVSSPVLDQPAYSPPEGGEQALRERYDKLKDIPVTELTQANRQELREIARDNLRLKYGDLIPPERIDKYVGCVLFADTDDLKAELGADYHPDILGYYARATDTITINLDAHEKVGDVLATLDHEGLHMVTQQIGADGRPQGVTGLKSRGIQNNNVSMNEGVTELFSIRNMQAVYPEYQSAAYVEEVGVMAAYEDVCGPDMLRRAYMENNVQLLRDDFDRHMGPGQFDAFCTGMDRLRSYSEHGMGSQAQRCRETLAQALNRYKERKEAVRNADPIRPNR